VGDPPTIDDAGMIVGLLDYLPSEAAMEGPTAVMAAAQL